MSSTKTVSALAKFNSKFGPSSTTSPRAPDSSRLDPRTSKIRKPKPAAATHIETRTKQEIQQAKRDYRKARNKEKRHAKSEAKRARKANAIAHRAATRNPDKYKRPQKSGANSLPLKERQTGAEGSENEKQASLQTEAGRIKFASQARKRKLAELETEWQPIIQEDKRVKTILTALEQHEAMTLACDMALWHRDNAVAEARKILGEKADLGHVETNLKKGKWDGYLCPQIRAMEKPPKNSNQQQLAKLMDEVNAVKFAKKALIPELVLRSQAIEAVVQTGRSIAPVLLTSPWPDLKATAYRILEDGTVETGKQRHEALRLDQRNHKNSERTLKRIAKSEADEMGIRTYLEVSKSHKKTTETRQRNGSEHKGNVPAHQVDGVLDVKNNHKESSESEDSAGKQLKKEVRQSTQELEIEGEMDESNTSGDTSNTDEDNSVESTDGGENTDSSESNSSSDDTSAG